MKQPGRFPWKGKLAGGLFGMLAGPFGFFLGFLIGHLIDLIMESAVIRRRISAFLADPDASSLSGWENGMYSYFTLAAAAFAANGGRARRNEEALYRRLGEYYPLRDGDYKYLQEILENVDGLGEEINLPAHARIVLEGAEEGKRDGLFRGLVSFASADGAAALRNPAAGLLRGIAWLWNVDADAWAGIREERSADETAWEILGLKPGASAEEVKRVFRVLASQFHPDGAAALSEIQRRETEEAFRRIRRAYDDCITSLTRSAG